MKLITHSITRAAFAALWLSTLAASPAWADASAPTATSVAATPTGEGQAAQDAPPPPTEVTVSPTGTAAVHVLEPDDAQILVGEPLQLRLQVSLPSGGELIAVRPSSNPFVEAVGDAQHTASNQPALSITVFRPGTYRFDVEAVWVDAEGKQRKTRSDAMEVTVQSVITDEVEPVLSAPGPYQTLRSRNLWLMGSTIAGICLALLVGLWLLWRRLQRPALEEAPPPPERPAWEIALAQIAALREDRELMEQRPIEFHQRLSEILREWIERRFDVGAPEMTSAEILDELRPRRLHLGQWIDEIREILADTDLVKFAKFSPPLEGSVRLLQRLEDLVLAVKQADQSPPPAVPPPIEGEIEVIAPVVPAAPQQQRPGEPLPARTPEDATREHVIRYDFGRPRTEEDEP